MPNTHFPNIGPHRIPKREKLSTSFFKAGIDWRKEFALAIIKDDWKQIKLWKDLLPYLIGPEDKGAVKPRKLRKASKKAIETLRKMEQASRPDLYPITPVESSLEDK